MASSNGEPSRTLVQLQALPIGTLQHDTIMAISNARLICSRTGPWAIIEGDESRLVKVIQEER